MEGGMEKSLDLKAHLLQTQRQKKPKKNKHSVAFLCKFASKSVKES
jgi:hypothetical protein